MLRILGHGARGKRRSLYGSHRRSRWINSESASTCRAGGLRKAPVKGPDGGRWSMAAPQRISNVQRPMSNVQVKRTTAQLQLPSHDWPSSNPGEPIVFLHENRTLDLSPGPAIESPSRSAPLMTSTTIYRTLLPWILDIEHWILDISVGRAGGSR